MNSISVFINGEEFQCYQKYDTNDNYDLIDVFTENDKFIGSIPNITIPDMDEEEYDALMDNFNNEVELFLEDEYY